MSLSGLLAIISGLGLMLVHDQLSRLARDWGGWAPLLFTGLAAFLILWGLNDVLQTIPSSRKRRPFWRLRGQRQSLPRTGLVYLGIMVVLFVGSLLGRSNMLMLVFSMMAGPFILNGWITYSMLRRTNVRRRVPKRAMAGEIVSVEVVLENRKRRLSSWLMAIRDRIGNEHENVDARVMFANVRPRDARVAYYQMRLMHRGRYFFGPIELTTQFPLGLVERGQVFEVTDEILIHPRVGRLTPRWHNDSLSAAELLRRQRTRPGAFDDDFHRIREYRWGDNPKAIHWRTSARRNELMVREFHENRDQNLAVFLELYQPKRPSQSDWERVELAVSFAATVCLEHLRQSRESSLHLATSGEQVAGWDGGGGSVGVESLLDTLAVLEAGPSPDVARMFYDSLPGLPANTRVLLITTRQCVDGKAPGFDDFDWDDESAESVNRLRVVEADPRELQSYFTID